VKREFGQPLTRAERRRAADRLAAQEAELIEEIVEAAEKIAAAKIAAAMGPNHELMYRTDPVWRLLTMIERAPYCCSLSDVARLMKISRQHAQRLGFEAARAGLVELASNDHDRRIVQLLLTERGRSEILQARHHRRIWIARLLLGLDTPRLLTATRVVRVIRQRLALAERERVSPEAQRGRGGRDQGPRDATGARTRPPRARPPRFRPSDCAPRRRGARLVHRGAGAVPGTG
jgi:DNA-binding MarR family transcriptional regulator